MTIKHTPGPWYDATKKDSIQGLIYSEKTGENIAVSFDPKNAQLIAASPDLLTALKELIHAVEHETEPYGRIIDGIANAKKAIYEAEGE